MKKRIYLIIIMCIVACFILTGCQSEKVKEADNNLVAQEKANTEIKNSTNNFVLFFIE